MESSKTGVARAMDEKLDRDGLVLDGEAGKRVKREEVERQLAKGDVTVIDLSLSDDEAKGSNAAQRNLSVFAQKAKEECDMLAGFFEEVDGESRRGFRGSKGGVVSGALLSMMGELVRNAQKGIKQEARRMESRMEIDNAHDKLLGLLVDLGTDAAKVSDCAPPPEVAPSSRSEGDEVEDVKKIGTYTSKRWLHWFREGMAKDVFQAGLREMGVGKEDKEEKVDEEGRKETEDGKGTGTSVVAEVEVEGFDDDGRKDLEDRKADEGRDVEALAEQDEGSECDQLNPSQYQTFVEGDGEDLDGEDLDGEDLDVDQLDPSQYATVGRPDMVVKMGDVEGESGSRKVGSGDAGDVAMNEVVAKEADEMGEILVGSSEQGAVVEEEVDHLRADRYDVQSGETDAVKSCAVERTEDVQGEEEGEEVDQLRASQYEHAEGFGLGEGEGKMEGSSKPKGVSAEWLKRVEEFNEKKAKWTDDEKRRWRRSLKWVRPSPVDGEDEGRSVKRRRGL